MSEQNKPNQSRRQLLKNIGLSVAASTVISGTATAVQAKVEQPENNKNDNTTGYRETQHVRDYYETL